MCTFGYVITNEKFHVNSKVDVIYNYIDEKENSILIVGSSKCVTDTLVSISDDIINFANMQYEISEKYGL